MSYLGVHIAAAGAAAGVLSSNQKRVKEQPLALAFFIPYLMFCKLQKQCLCLYLSLRAGLHRDCSARSLDHGLRRKCAG